MVLVMIDTFMLKLKMEEIPWSPCGTRVPQSSNLFSQPTGITKGNCSEIKVIIRLQTANDYFIVGLISWGLDEPFPIIL